MVEWYDLSNLRHVGKVTEEKLKEYYIYNVFDIFIKGTNYINNIIDDRNKAEDIVLQATKLINEHYFKKSSPFVPATEYTLNTQRLKIGLQEFDEEIGGIDKVTMIYGEQGCGKTQFALTLTVEALKQYPDKKVLYIDTEGRVLSERLKEIAKKRYNITNIDNVLMTTAHNVSELKHVLYTLTYDILKDVSLFVIDSLLYPFRSEYSGRGQLADRQQQIIQILTILNNMTIVCKDLTVLLTTHAQKDPQSMGLLDPTRFVGGLSLGHNVGMILYIKRFSLQSNKRTLGVQKASYTDYKEVQFEISNAGIVEKKK